MAPEDFHTEQILQEIMKNLMIFTDPGLDDAIALTWLLERLPGGVTVDIVAVAGNVPAEDALSNVCQIVSELPSVRADVYIWSSLSIEQNYEYNERIHGNAFQNKRQTSPLYRGDIMEDWHGEEAQSDIDIIVIAACTVLKSLADAGKINGISRLVIMGGGVRESNYHGLEFNQMMDPEAFNYILNRYSSIAEVVSLESCRRPAYDCLSLDTGEFENADSLLLSYIDSYKNNAIERNAARCIPYDLIAFLVYLKKELFTFEKKHILGAAADVRAAVVTRGSESENSEFWKNILLEQHF